MFKCPKCGNLEDYEFREMWVFDEDDNLNKVYVCDACHTEILEED